MQVWSSRFFCTVQCWCIASPHSQAAPLTGPQWGQGNKAGGFLSCFPSLLLTLLLCFGQVWSHHFLECATSHWQLLASSPQFSYWAWYSVVGNIPLASFGHECIINIIFILNPKQHCTSYKGEKLTPSQLKLLLHFLPHPHPQVLTSSAMTGLQIKPGWRKGIQLLLTAMDISVQECWMKAPETHFNS